MTKFILLSAHINTDRIGVVHLVSVISVFKLQCIQWRAKRLAKRQGSPEIARPADVLLIIARAEE